VPDSVLPVRVLSGTIPRFRSGKHGDEHEAFVVYGLYMPVARVILGFRDLVLQRVTHEMFQPRFRR
jgi:hypothetical protein